MHMTAEQFYNEGWKPNPLRYWHSERDYWFAFAEAYKDAELEVVRQECRAKENDLIELERLSGMSLERESERIAHTCVDQPNLACPACTKDELDKQQQSLVMPSAAEPESDMERDRR